MGILNRKVNVNIINSDWVFLYQNIKLKSIPRENELLLTTNDKYYRVLNVIYSLNPNKEIYIIVEEFPELEK